MNGQIDSWMDKQIDCWTDRWIDSKTDGWTVRWMDKIYWQINTQTNI